MMGGIDKDYYCDCYKDPFKECGYIGQCEDCGSYHRKYPTIEQFVEEYGEDVPDDFPVWERIKPIMNAGSVCDWVLIKFKDRSGNETNADFICACTPWGRPPADWRPYE